MTRLLLNCDLAANFRADLELLYGRRWEKCLDRLARLIGRYGVGEEAPAAAPARWSERDRVLITYADILRRPDEAPLATLGRFLRERLTGALNTVHLLPFFPATSDDGFAVSDYRAVDPACGEWEDVAALGADFRLAFDLVLNHCSASHAWFKQYLNGIAPGRESFHETDPKTDLSAVVRPRSLPLLTKFPTRRGERHVWTTFSEDQIDLNFANPDVLFSFFDLLLYYYWRGARLFRLDAVAFLWKQPGTNCLHLPQTHAVVRLLRRLADLTMPDALVLTETNVPHAENVSYFGAGDEAHLVYNFSLPPLLLHGLLRGSAERLTAWAAELAPPPPGSAFLNFTASHDGIGVRPLEGLVPEAEVTGLAEAISQRGGHVSTRRVGSTDRPYELNVTYFDALADPGQAYSESHIARFLCSQAVALALRGLPAIYFHSLTATRNDFEGVGLTGRARSINRHKWDERELAVLLNNPSTATARVFRELTRLLELRAKHPAFHPDGEQLVCALHPAVFAVQRTSPDRSECLTALHNFSAQTVTVPVDGRAPGLHSVDFWDDALSGQPRQRQDSGLELKPYEVLWLLSPPPAG